MSSTLSDLLKNVPFDHSEFFVRDFMNTQARNIALHHTNDMQHALYLFAMGGDAQAIQVILPYVDANATEQSALRAAIDYGNMDVVEVLLPYCDWASALEQLQAQMMCDDEFYNDRDVVQTHIDAAQAMYQASVLSKHIDVTPTTRPLRKI